MNSAKLANSPEHSIKFHQNKKGEQPNWKYKRKKHRKVRMPKWHNEACDTLLKKIKQSVSKQFLSAWLYTERIQKI